MIAPEEVAERLTNLVTDIRVVLDDEAADRQTMLEEVDRILTRIADELTAPAVLTVDLVIDLFNLFGLKPRCEKCGKCRAGHVGCEQCKCCTCDNSADVTEAMRTETGQHLVNCPCS